MSRRRTEEYVVDGERVPSVTEILDACGLYNFSNVPARHLEAARKRGEAVHEWTDLEDAGHIPAGTDPDPEIAGYVQAYRRWQHESGWEGVASEEVVVCEEYRYAGTLDLRGYCHNYKNAWNQLVVDKKCVQAVTAATRLQCEGYSFAYGGEDGSGSLRRASLQLKPDGRFNFVEYDQPEDLHDWLAAVRMAAFKVRHRLEDLAA